MFDDLEYKLKEITMGRIREPDEVRKILKDADELSVVLYSGVSAFSTLINNARVAFQVGWPEKKSA